MRFWGVLAIVLLLTSTASAQSDDNLLGDLMAENGATATVDDARIYYERAGNPDHPAVILIHGFGGSTFTWRDTLPALADAGFYAVALDLPPFGLSDKSTDLDYSREQMAAWVIGLMDELDIDTAAVVGHSMGGAVAARLAVDYPKRLNALVFVAAAVYESSDAAASAGDSNPFSDLLSAIDPDSPLATGALNLLLTEDRFAELLTSAYGDDFTVTDDIIDGYTQPLQLPTWQRGFLAYLGADNADSVRSDDLTAADLPPTLIMWGAADTWVPLSVGEALHEALPQAERITYENVGHLPMEEAPQAFNEDLIAFLQQGDEAPAN